MESDCAKHPENASVDATVAIVAQVWQEVLQTPTLPCADDDFFALGGDSMTMVMAEFRIGEELSVSLPAGVLLGASTIRQLSCLIDAHRRGSHEANVPARAPPSL